MTFSENEPKYGGTFKTHIVQDAPTWDPTDPGINSYSSPFQLFYNRLLKADMSFESAFAGEDNFFKLKLEGDLAAAFEQVDELTYTFNLREGVKFHDIPPMNGRELTAEDVVFSFEAYQAPGALGQSAIFRDVDKVELLDDYTIQVSMTKPASYFLYSLVGPLVMIFSRAAYEELGDLKSAPMGSGPFILDQHEYRNLTVARKNPDYFVEGRPYMDGVEARWIPDRSALVSAYRSGQIDVFTGYGTFEEYEAIMETERGKTDVNVFQQNSGGQPNFAVNHRKSPWNDVRVRRGLSMALDRDAMVAARWKVGRWSIGLPTDWSGKHYPPAGEDFGPYFQYNPSEAKAILDEAGFPEDFEILVSSFTGAPDDQVVLAAEYWKQIGLNPTLKVVDGVAFNQQYYGKEFDIVFSGPLTGGTDLDDFGYRLMHSTVESNIYGINDPEVDRITEEVQRTFEREPREALGAELHEREFDQVNRIWATSYLLQDFKRPYVQGGYISHDVYFWANAWGLYQLADTWLDKDV
jgi:ABC-type transport system substrate-binding protein